ncbi:MAG: oligosaccharide flippase family protein [Sandaracinaceae bacterium]|nr:oligosaccharide flippase family protein [Sandaracinaceae bacterium]
MSAPAAPEESIARKALRGAVALGVGQSLVGVADFATGALLARSLSAAEFGIFGIVTFTLGFLTSLGDVGLGASLIRQAEEPDETDYRSIFTLQQLLTSIVTVVTWLAAPAIAHRYGLPERDAWLFRAVALSFLASSLRTIPAIRLERHLSFDRLSIAEVAQALTFSGLAVGLAYAGMGAASFAIALVARSIVGALVIQLVSPWRFALGWDWPRLKKHLEFGIPYQGISVVSLVKDSITPLLIGLLLGAADVGHVNWAQMVSAYPLLAIGGFARVYMPMFARLQADRAMLGAAVERVIWATNSVAAPLAVLLLALFSPFTRVLFGAQWLDASGLFHLTWFANLFVPTVTPLLGLLSAMGRSRIPLAFAVVWMLGTWIVGAPTIALYGSIGYGIANVAVQLSNVALVYLAKREAPFRVIPTVAPAWGSAVVVGLTAHFLERALPIEGPITLALYVTGALLAYAGCMTLIDREAVAKLRRFLGGTS